MYNLNDNNFNYYPIINLPKKILDLLNTEINNNNIIDFLDIEYPEIDLKIYKKIKINEEQYNKVKEYSPVVQKIFYKDFDKKEEINKSKLKKWNINKAPSKKTKFNIFDYNDNLSMFGEGRIVKHYINDDKKFYSKDFDAYGNYFIENYKLPIRPDNYNTEEYESRPGCFFLFLAGFIFFCGTFFYRYIEGLYTKGSVILGLLCLILTIITYLLKSTESRRIEKPISEFENEFNDYLNKIKEIKNEVLIEHKKERKEIDTLVQEYLRKENLYELVLHKITKNETIGCDNPRTGKTESYFKNYLNSYFGKQLKTNITAKGYGDYFPDFTIICNKTNFHIDIEIDEPYTAKYGKSIHCKEDVNDLLRNSYFTGQNWGVIRFSEKQIIQQPNECCDLIFKILNAVINKTNIINHNVNNDKRWSKEESSDMANSNYRNTYLPSHLKIMNIDYNDYDLFPF